MGVRRGGEKAGLHIKDKFWDDVQGGRNGFLRYHYEDIQSDMCCFFTECASEPRIFSFLFVNDSADISVESTIVPFRVLSTGLLPV